MQRRGKQTDFNRIVSRRHPVISETVGIAELPVLIKIKQQNRPGSCQKKSQQPRQSLSPKQNRNAAECGQNEKYLKYHNGKDLIYQIKPKANITKKTFF